MTSYIHDLIEAAYRSRAKWIRLPSRYVTEIPESIGKLRNLKSLYLSGNTIKILPESIGQLRNLRNLDLSNNLIETIPESIGHLKNLRRLDLSNNNLKFLPKSLGELTSLQDLYLFNNPSLKLPEEILINEYGEPSKPSSILNYYFRVLEGFRPLNEAKLILVGRGTVGKTSLVNRIVFNKFEKDEKKTEGIRITEWKFNLHEDDIRLNIWDFGGQEIMHATHQFFLTQRSLYLVVLNGREGGEDIDVEYWLRLIESFGGDSPVIVVMNKIKEHPFDLNRRGLQQKFPSIKAFIKTDCENGRGIKDLIKTIKQETDQLEHLRDAFPKSWFVIKSKLAKMKKNFLNFAEYTKLCSQNGELELPAQEALATYLHNLGIVLNYNDDPRLQETHVLNPHWVTGGIYKILNSEKLEKQHGEIHLNDLSEVLDSKEYPINMRRFIFDLMKKFELCFSFPNDDCYYLIPELLDKQEPKEASEFKANDCLNFQYHYSVLPEGILPRFIVRTHILSEKLPRWRTGVILEFEGNKALIKADIQDKKVFISVSGSTSGRRRLLAIIRSDFERIHNDIRNLEPKEMVPLPNFPDVVIPYRKLLALERTRINRFLEYANDSVIELGVNDLLNGVDLNMNRGEGALRLFYSYSHKDENLRDELETHLKLLQRQGLINSWHDRKIEAGDEWKNKIDENLKRADIILLLISADFIASDYCYEKEMKYALERHEQGSATVIPIILRDVNWKKAPFSKLQVLPKDGLAVTKWDDRDSAWRNISENIESIAIEKEFGDIPF